MVYLDEHRYNFNPRPGPLDRALEAARRAVELDPSSQTARAALAATHFFRHQLGPFKAEAERALALNPNDPGTLVVLGADLMYAGDERGIALIRKRMKLDPFHPTVFHIMIADYHFDKGEYEEALVAARKIDTPGYFWTEILLAGIYAELGDQKEAARALKELLRLYPGFTIQKLVEEWKKWNASDERIRRSVAALRKAGLPK